MILPYAAIAFLVLVTVYSGIVSFRQPEGRSPNWIFPARASRLLRKVIVILTAALLLGLVVWMGTGARKPTHRSSRFLIPDGYTGWVRVEFEVKDAQPLPMEDGQYILKIPADGALRTSSPEQYGLADDHFYYYSAQSVRPIPDSGQSALIWGKLNGEASGASGTRKYEEFFVGTRQQFKDQPK
jgi:hypothetical protein